jgi:hypothetical protein
MEGDMTHDRTMTLYFNDGSKMTFEFPEQAKSAAAKQIKLSEFMNSKNVVVESEGQLMVFPMTSIKYIAFNSAGPSFFKGPALPKQSIISARIRDF